MLFALAVHARLLSGVTDRRLHNEGGRHSCYLHSLAMSDSANKSVGNFIIRPLSGHTVIYEVVTRSLLMVRVPFDLCHLKFTNRIRLLICLFFYFLATSKVISG